MVYSDKRVIIAMDRLPDPYCINEIVFCFFCFCSKLLWPSFSVGWNALSNLVDEHPKNIPVKSF